MGKATQGTEFSAPSLSKSWKKSGPGASSMSPWTIGATQYLAAMNGKIWHM